MTVFDVLGAGLREAIVRASRLATPLLFVIGVSASVSAQQEPFLDLDQDGVRDSLRAPTFEAETIFDPTTVEVVSGADGTTLRAFGTGEEGDLFGYAVLVTPDLDADGHPDIAIGAPRTAYGSRHVGRVHLYSSAAGRLITSVSGRSGDRFGVSLSLTNDADGDGTPDVAIGSVALDLSGVYARRDVVLLTGTRRLMNDHLSAVADADEALFGNDGVSARAIPQDPDADGDVDSADLAILLAQFSQTAPPATCDFNADGVVDRIDLERLLAAFGSDAAAIGGPRGGVTGTLTYCDFFICDNFCQREDIQVCGAPTDIEDVDSGGGDGGEAGGGGPTPGSGGDPPACSVIIVGQDQVLLGESATLSAALSPTGGSVLWQVTQGASLLETFAPSGDSFSFTAGQTPGVVEVTASYNAATCNGPGVATFALTIDECFVSLSNPQDLSLGQIQSITANARPPGGTLEWEVVEGADQIEMMPTGASTIEARSVGAGGSVAIRVDHTSPTGCVRTALVSFDTYVVPGADFDADGVSDEEEFLLGIDPFDPDTDDDGYEDGFEIGCGMDALSPASPANVDSDADGLVDEHESCIGLNSFEADTDRDGADDGFELANGLDALNPDSDADGLLDGEEVDLGSNPLAVDTDGDGLRDGDEVEGGFDPTRADTDGDGESDGLEDADADDVANLDEFSLGTDWLDSDSDGDRLTDGEELALGTRPLGYDTDGDGLSDGGELATSHDPLNPDTNGDGFSDGLVDSDGDGLSNAVEEQHGADPSLVDTDGDGVDDATEISQGSLAFDATDGGAPLPSDERILIRLTIGDASKKQSERWTLRVGPYAVQTNAGGSTQRDMIFSANSPLPIRVFHNGPGQSPLGYHANILELESPETIHVLIDDPDEVLGKHYCHADDGPSCNPAAGKEGRLFLTTVDLDIDSDNNDGFAPPSRSKEEDEAEDSSAGAKVVIVNRDDDDGDRIPDYADGFGAVGPDSAGGTIGDRFTPMVVQLDGLDGLDRIDEVEASLIYSSADLSHVSRTEVQVPDIQSSFYRYNRGGRLLRVWRKDGSEPRTPQDFIASTDPLSLDELRDGLTLYVEAVNGSAVATTITLSVRIPDGPAIAEEIRVLPFDSVTGLSEPEIAGFTIHNGSTSGTPGNDIILGTDGDDTLNGGAGDDIIVAGAGDDVIDAGDGFDVVFASRGQNDIDLGETPIGALSAGLRSGEHEKLLHERERPFSTEELLMAYRFIYGQDDLWLQLFLDTNGVVEAVASDGIPLFSASDWDRCYSPDPDFAHLYKIQVEFDKNDPFEAAGRLRQELLHIFGHAAQMRLAAESMAIDELADAEFGPDDTEITDYQSLRTAAFDNAIETTALIGRITAEGIAMFNVGADLVLVAEDLENGNWLAGLQLFPFVTSTVVDAGRRVVMRTIDNVVLGTKIKRVIYPVGSEMGFIARRDMALDEVAHADGSRTLLLGTPQRVVEGGQDTAHAATVLEHATGYASRTGSGQQASYVMMNRSVWTATAVPGASGRQPDIIVVRNTPEGPKVDLYEIRSNRQTRQELEEKLNEMMTTLPEATRGGSGVIELDEPFPNP